MSPATGISVGRAELGLKQAFQLADKDNSGGVSSAELGVTIRSITSKSNTGSIVGFDTGAIRLLLTLMEIVNGPPHDDESAHSEERIAHLFRMMDLDGDGQVSWWEWRQVLDGTATVINVGEPQEGDPPRYIDALDPLVVSLEAAHAALMAENGGIVKPKPRQALDDYDMNALDNPLLGKNKQYQERLAALRSKNSRLQKKLEEALSSSQTVTPPPARAYPISRRTDEIDDEMRKMLEAEKRRRTELEAEVERLNNVSSEMVKSRSEGELERAAMSNRLAEEANRLREEMILAYMSRKQYERSAFVLRPFFLMVRENMLAKKIARERQRLVHAMTGLVARKKYIGIKSIRNDAAVKVQSHYRRVMGKRKCDLITQSVRIIQEAVLMRNLRRAAKAERAELWKQLVQLKLNAGLRIQKAMLRCVLNKKRQEEKRRAAVLIQSRYRGHLSRRVRPADEAEPMILKIVSRPPLENAVGLWISHPRHNKENGDDNEREALVMSVDKSAEVMRVRYLEEDPVVNVVVNYHDSRISHWFKMSTPEEERSEIQAVTKLQAVMRGRLSRVRVNGIIANKAAIKIQAIFRGRRVRKLLNLPREQEHAATKIQAVFRG
ncbi:ASPM, partial [Symbiodinium microadriaticum]